MNNNSSTSTYSNAGGLSANDIIDKNIIDLKIKFGIDNIPIENHPLPNMYWMPKMCKYPIKATITHKIFETNSSFHVKKCKTGNV